MGTYTIHPIDQVLLDYPPEGVTYFISKPGKIEDWIRTHIKFSFARKIYQQYQKYLSMFRPSVRDVEVDLIHSCRRIISTDLNWVLDFENAGSLLGYPLKGWDSPVLKKIVKRALLSPNLKKLIAWSMAGAKSLVNTFGSSGIKEKLEVVYPAIPNFEFTKRKKADEVTLLHVSRGSRGVKLTLSAFDILRKKYDNLKLVVRAEPPSELLARYAGYEDIKFVPRLPSRESVFKLYQQADIFVMPSAVDGFGYVYLEAMNFCLPIVALKIHSAVREIVEDGKNGFLVEPEYEIFNPDYTLRDGDLFKKIDALDQPKTVRGLVEKLSQLIESSSLRYKMGRAGKKEIENGKFSIRSRNKKLKEIYEEAVRH
jgi:glycosyltransferase involved in cell wall biosynthesis